MKSWVALPRMRRAVGAAEDLEAGRRQLADVDEGVGDDVAAGREDDLAVDDRRVGRRVEAGAAAQQGGDRRHSWAPRPCRCDDCRRRAVLAGPPVVPSWTRVLRALLLPVATSMSNRPLSMVSADRLGGDIGGGAVDLDAALLEDPGRGHGDVAAFGSSALIWAPGSTVMKLAGSALGEVVAVGDEELAGAVDRRIDGGEQQTADVEHRLAADEDPARAVEGDRAAAAPSCCRASGAG